MEAKLRAALAVVVLVLLAPTAVAVLGQAWAPSAVAVTPSTGGILVSWTPGTEAAESYRLYGVVASSLVFIGSTDALTFTTNAAYSTFAVTGVKDNVESSATYGSMIPCFYVGTDPIDVHERPCEGGLPIGLPHLPAQVDRHLGVLWRADPIGTLA